MEVAKERGRPGRPKIAESVKIEQALTTKGIARAGYAKAGERTVRMRLYNAASRLGMKIRTKKVDQGAVRYIEAIRIES